jgi:hypothetical protein
VLFRALRGHLIALQEHLGQWRIPVVALSKSIDIKRRHTDVERLPSRQRGIALSGLDIQATSGIAGNTQPNPATT